jgi:hypothetical protein
MPTSGSIYFLFSYKYSLIKATVAYIDKPYGKIGLYAYAA